MKFFVLELNLSKEQSGFMWQDLTQNSFCVCQDFFVGSSFNQPPQSKDYFGEDNYVHTSIQPMIFTSYLLNVVQ